MRNTDLLLIDASSLVSYDFSIVKFNNSSPHRVDDTAVMSRHNYRCTCFIDPLKKSHNFDRSTGVKVSGRFISKKY